MKNFSVITEVRLALLRYAQIPEGDFTQIKLSEILQPGHEFQIIPGIKPLSCAFEEVEKESDAGTCFEKKLSFELSRLCPEVSELLKPYINNRIVAVITDANGFSWLVYPLLRTIRRTLPGNAKGTNITEVSFSGKWITESPSVQINS